MQGVYKITNLKNNKVYIGCSDDITRRWAEHKRDGLISRNEYTENHPLYKDMRSIGLDNFEFEVLNEFDNMKDAYEYERKMIDEYKSTDSEFGYNRTTGGENGNTYIGGDNHFNRKLNSLEVKEIRTLYNTRSIRLQEAYLLYSDIIEFNGFKKVWNGYTWKNIMPEVYTAENKAWHKNQALARKGADNGRAKLNNTEILNIRTRRNNGESRMSVYKDYQSKLSKQAFDSIWLDQHWPLIQPE